MSQPITTATSKPVTTPSAGAAIALSAEDLIVAQTKSAVSIPSRATAMKAIQTTPQSESEANCAAVSSRSLRANWREFELIHRIIQVTMATATNESVPPRISCAWNDSV